MMTVRALFTAAKIDSAASPFDTLHLKVFYPAKMSGSDAERMTGVVPVDDAHAPLPVVIFFNGINVGPEAYQWLAVALVERGLAVVTFTWVSETLPGVVGLTPGIDLARVRPDTYGSGPTASAMPALLSALNQLQANGVLAGKLALDKIILGGHSAGGTVALQNATARYFPQVAAAFSYAGHTMASTMLGFAPGTILPAGERPILLAGGTQDGVIAASRGRYGEHADMPDPLTRTFNEAIGGGRRVSYLVILNGANHFTLVHPIDETTGRSFLDLPATQPEGDLRALFAELVGLFIEAHVKKSAEAIRAFEQKTQAPHPLIATLRRK